MKAHFSAPFLKALGSLLLFVPLALAAQPSVDVSKLFDTGLNTGYLVSHWQAGSASDSYNTWAVNAGASWMAAWPAGSAESIIPDPAQPTVADNKYREALLTTPASDCSNAWVRAMTSVYRAGYQLGTAYVKSGGDCSACLKMDLQKSALQMQAIGATTGMQRFNQLGEQLDLMAKSIREGLDAEAAARQNVALSADILDIIREMQNTLLPAGLQVCNSRTQPQAPAAQTQTPAPPPAAPKAPAKDKGRLGRTMMILAGINSAKFNETDGNAETAAGTGFQVGFNMMYGNRAYGGAGVYYFKYVTGEEFESRYFAGQVVDTSETMFFSGFKMPFYFGGKINAGDLAAIRFHGGVVWYLSTASMGEFSSVGDLLINDNSFSFMLEASASIKFLALAVSFERGLTDMLESEVDAYQIQVLSFSAGIVF